MPFSTLSQPDQKPLSQSSRKVLCETTFSATQPNAIAKENLNFTSNSANNSPNNSKSNEWLNRLKLHNVALLHLFGFIELQDTSPLAGKGWRLTKAKALPFGKALMELLQKTNWKKGLLNEAEDDFIGLFIEPPSEPQSPEPKLDIVEQQPTPTEILKEEFQALDLFLEWEKNLELPESESQDGVFVFKVSLQIHIQKSKDKFSKETIWRKIAIPSNLTLYDFSSAILEAFNFYNDHLHQFTYKDRQGFVKTINHPYAEHSDGDSLTDKILLRDWQISTGDRITYVFDFGDWWEFNVVLESINEPAPKKEAKVIDQKGEAPKQYDDDECEDYE